jgi:hypothetical protein
VSRVDEGMAVTLVGRCDPVVRGSNVVPIRPLSFTGVAGQQPPPPTSIRAVGPPMWVMGVVVMGRRLVLAGGCPGARG